MAKRRHATYSGPHCPRCNNPLGPELLHSGTIVCPKCKKPFEATAFEPPQREVVPTQPVAGTSIDGAIACANHPRNVAVTECKRCGLFICALCEMNVGGGSYCPACFDRLRSEDAIADVAVRYRDYAAMARVAVIVGFLFAFMALGLPFGIVAVIYARKGIKQRRDMGESVRGMYVIIAFAIFEIIVGALYPAFLIWSLFQKTS